MPSVRTQIPAHIIWDEIQTVTETILHKIGNNTREVIHLVAAVLRRVFQAMVAQMNVKI